LPFSKFSLFTIFSVQSLPPFVSSFSSSSSVETTFSEWNDDDDVFVLLPLDADLFFAALKAANRVFFAAERKELDFAADARGGKNFLPKEEREEKEENPTHHPRGIKRGSPFRSALWKEDVEQRGIMIQSCLLSLRGELEVTFCVTLSTSDVFSGDHPTRNGLEQLLLQRSTTQRKEAVVETSVCAIRRSESGRGRYKRSRSRNVQEVVHTEQRETNKVRRVSRNHERVGEERVHGRRENEFETESRGGVNRDR
jgi:hypothetical protein